MTLALIGALSGAVTGAPVAGWPVRVHRRGSGASSGPLCRLAPSAGSILVFLVLEARPFTRRVDEAIRRRTRELSEELEGLITSSDMDDHEPKRDEDD